MRKDSAGNVKNIQRVPLAYGPVKKFLSRIGQNLSDPKVAIKLPRMSFEITGLAYNPGAQANRMNQYTSGTGYSGTKAAVYSAAPYNMSIDLSILTVNQDDALQILEQIVPYFQPEFTITINEVTDIGLTSDIPIVLTGVNLSEEYEGDFLSRKAIVYTLSFDLKVNYYPAVDGNKTVITKVSVDESTIMDRDFGFTQEYVAEWDTETESILDGRDETDDNERTT